MESLARILERIRQMPINEWDISGIVDKASVRYHCPLEGSHDSWAHLTKTENGYKLKIMQVPKQELNNGKLVAQFENEEITRLGEDLCDSHIYAMIKQDYD